MGYVGPFSALLCWSLLTRIISSGQGAMSTAKFGGAKLKDVLKLAGLDEDIEDQHVRFHSRDGMMASIGTEKALNPYGDCIVAYEMNGEDLPRDHGVRS